jgi:hypothetical protein
MLATVDVGTGVLARLLRRVSNQGGLAATLEAADGVGARCLGSTDSGSAFAFVDVDAEGPVGLEPGPAAAGAVLAALCVVGAVEVGLAAGSNLGRQAAGSAVALVAGRALADVPGDAVDALGPDAALM